MSLSPDTVVGVGDAENDITFLSMCGRSIAVANALDAVKQRADYVTQGRSSAGVREIINQLVSDDLQSLDAVARARA